MISEFFTDAYLRTSSWFIARHGRPHLILSDNGTNFFGAAGYLNLSRNEISKFLAGNNIRWQFNLLHAPHRGVIREITVKSIKRHLIKSKQGQTFTFEKLFTVISRIEAILNLYLSTVRVNADQEKTIIIPGHFLIGDSLVSDLEYWESRESNLRLSKRYQIVCRITATIWKV